MIHNPSLLNLVVIRTSDIDGLAAFYSGFEITFSKHSHGAGPLHYASENCGVTLEIYPQENVAQATTAARLGFKVQDIDSLLPLLVERGGIVTLTARDSEFGRRAVIKDPAGHKVELVQ